MGFRLVPKSVTLNDLERHNGRYFVLLICVKLGEARPILPAIESSRKNLVFDNI